jgi:hypothetical protein
LELLVKTATTAVNVVNDCHPELVEGCIRDETYQGFDKLSLTGTNVCHPDPDSYRDVEGCIGDITYQAFDSLPAGRQGRQGSG